MNVKNALKVVYQETRNILIIPGESSSLLASKLSPLVKLVLESHQSDHGGHSFNSTQLSILNNMIYDIFQILHF